MKTMALILSLMIIIVWSCENPDQTSEPTPSPQTTPLVTEPTPPPGINPPVVVNVRASKLQYTDHIRIVWDTAAGAESYIVYRYLHKSEGSFDAEFPVITNYLDDTTETALADTPYFYKVASVINTVSSDVSANFTEGIYSSFTDPFEPNDTKVQAEEIGTEVSIAGIYSFAYGEAQDEDWYVYTGGSSSINIQVTLPAGSVFSNELTLEIENNSSSIVLEEGLNTLGCSDSDDIYFRIYFNTVDPDIDDVGTYEIKLNIF